jgi:hypothetical protein
MKIFPFFLCFIFVCVFVLYAGSCTYRQITFNQEVGSYLEQAASANTVPLAKEMLAKALNGIERRGLTSGNTSLFFDVATNDVGIWYRNIKDSYEELDRVSQEGAKTSSLETSNMLLKLRDTLTDHREGNTVLVVPQSLAFHSYIKLFFLLDLCAFAIFLLAVVCFFWGMLINE